MLVRSQKGEVAVWDRSIPAPGTGLGRLAEPTRQHRREQIYGKIIEWRSVVRSGDAQDCLQSQGE